MTLVFVCTGNTCRSSMAEVMFRDMLKRKGINEIEVISAGVAAYEGDSASPHAIQVMKERGLDMSYHRACQLTLELIGSADLILTMTASHKNMVKVMEPAAFDKTYTLKEYVGETPVDIMDPFGGSIETYRHCAREIEDVLNKLVKVLVKD